MSEAGGPISKNRALAPPTPNPVEQKLRDVGKLYEKQFLREMLKSMRSTVSEGGFLKSNAGEKIFREQLDHEYVEKWGDRGGIGLADLIYDQLVQKYGPQLGLKEPMQKPQGPLPLEKTHLYSGPTRVSAPKDPTLTYRFDRMGEVGSATPLSSPWSGKLIGSRRLEEDQQLLEMAYDNGLRGKLVFRGQVERLNLGQSVQQGETLGVLSPEAKSFYWTLQTEGPELEGTKNVVSE